MKKGSVLRVKIIIHMLIFLRVTFGFNFRTLCCCSPQCIILLNEAYLVNHFLWFFAKLQLQCTQNTTLDIGDVHRFCLNRQHHDKTASAFWENQVVCLECPLETFLVGGWFEVFFSVRWGFEDSYIFHLQIMLKFYECAGTSSIKISIMCVEAVQKNIWNEKPSHNNILTKVPVLFSFRPLTELLRNYK